MSDCYVCISIVYVNVIGKMTYPRRLKYDSCICTVTVPEITNLCFSLTNLCTFIIFIRRMVLPVCCWLKSLNFCKYCAIDEAGIVIWYDWGSLFVARHRHSPVPTYFPAECVLALTVDKLRHIMVKDTMKPWLTTQINFIADRILFGFICYDLSLFFVESIIVFLCAQAKQENYTI